MIKLLFGMFFPFLLFAGSNDGSILLMNDSPFILSATVQGYDGSFLGQYTIQPGQQINWTTNLSPTLYKHPGTPNVSLTPYTVIWQCVTEDFYSMRSDISPGALVRANQCQGPRFCKAKQKPEEKEAPASTLKKTK